MTRRASQFLLKPRPHLAVPGEILLDVVEGRVHLLLGLLGAARSGPHDRPMSDRYAIRPDPQGFRIFDRMTGETVVLALTAQDGLSEQDAQHTADRPNRRAK